jgi:hypothetical protein
MTDELPFRVVRSNSYDETLARCTNLPIAQAAYRGRAGDCEEQVKGAQLVTGRESIGCSPHGEHRNPSP